MESLEPLAVQGAAAVVAEGPGGRKVLRADGQTTVRIDLGKLGVDPLHCDLMKLEVKADRAAFLRVSLENFPTAGDLSHWYVLDTARGAFDWRTIWVDLNRPEEIKAAGTYKGMEKEDPNARGLVITGNVKDLNRKAQGPGRSIWLGPVRLAKKAVDLDWDQREAPYRFDGSGNLTFTFPLRVTNRLDQPVTAVLELEPVDAVHAEAQLSKTEVSLAPKQMQTVQASLTLPAAAVRQAPPLYCERFEARASAKGIKDSEVTILRSSDPIPLSVTVPVAEEKLRFPLLPRRRDVPASLTGITLAGDGRPLTDDPRAAALLREAAATGPDDLDTALDGPLDVRWSHRRGFNYWGNPKDDWHQAGQRFREGLTACAFLYDCTGDKKYLEKGTAMLLRAAERFPGRVEQWRKTPHAPISHGIFAPNVLALGWSTGGMRPPYSCQRHGLFNDFDLLAADMDPKAREKIIRGFILPAAIQMRNHYFGLTNQQDVTNYPVLYAGLVARNWPLVSHAYDSEHGVLGQIEWGFTDTGLAGEVNYHAPAIDPLLYGTELLRQIGIDLYDKRLYEIIHSAGALAAGKPYNRPIVAFLDSQRFPKDVRAASETKTDGVHLSTGLTVLKWGKLEVGMNWGMQLHRSAPDRCSLRLGAPGGHPLRDVGGGNYSHSSLGQSMIIIDEGRQNPVPAEVVSHDVTGPVQHVQARSDKHFPGSTITRTFALLGEHVVVLDRVTSDRPRTVDWCLRYKGGGLTHEAIAEGLSVGMKPVAGSFTDKPSDTAHGTNFGAKLTSKEHYVAATDEMWTQRHGALTMAGAKDTQVLAFAVPAAFSAWKKEKETGVPVLMVRRSGVKETDFVAALSAGVKSVEQKPVLRADGGKANAIGALLTFTDGRGCRVIASFEPKGTAVKLGSLTTEAPFATDYKDD